MLMRITRSYRHLLISTLCWLCSSNVLPAEDWPHWRGAQRNGITSEHSGWDGGQWRIKKSWTVQLAEGSSSPIVIDDELYVLGWKQGHERLYCLDTTTGKTKWTGQYQAPRYGRRSAGDKGVYSGTSSTPEYDQATGYIYTLGCDGELCCWEENKRLWWKNLYEAYQIAKRPDVGGLRGGRSQRDYGYTTSPLVIGDQLIVEVGDTQKGTVKSFHKGTGRELWTSECRDEAGHSGGLVPMKIDGKQVVAVLTMRNLLVVEVAGQQAGQTRALHPWTTDFANNISTPAHYQNAILVTSAYNQYAMCRLDLSPRGAKQVWQNNNPSGVCSAVIHNDRIYWAWRGVHSVDFKTGQEVWRGGKVGATGSCLLTSDDKLIALANRGDLMLVDAGANNYKELANIKTGHQADVWPHVVLANGRVFCKDRTGKLICYRVTN